MKQPKTIKEYNEYCLVNDKHLKIRAGLYRGIAPGYRYEGIVN